MILKGSQRGGAADLAAHLLNDRENDHVTVVDLRGFVARDLHGAFAEAYAISKGTKCGQFLFSLSLSPPKQAEASERDLMAAVERAEATLGLTGQPRAVVLHEKNGRRHAHAVWSRIDAGSMTAINLPHFKNRLTGLARDLYLDHGWDLPDGLRRDGGKSPLDFTLAEWQQAKRLRLDPREIKQSFRDAWKHSDSAKAFRHALEDKGYFLAEGDRRGFVALDIHGEVFSVPRMLGIKTKEIQARLGDPAGLASVAETRERIASGLTDRLHAYIDQIDATHERDRARLEERRREMVRLHREERGRLTAGQSERRQAEVRERARRFATGFKGLWDRVSGRHAAIRRQNEREAWDAVERDRKQRDDLVFAQIRERRALQERMDALRRRHARDRTILARDIARAMRMKEEHRPQAEVVRMRERARAPDRPGPSP